MARAQCQLRAIRCQPRWSSLAAYERTWTRFLAWTAAASFDPRSLPFPTALEAYRFLGDGKNAASLKQIRAALSFAYKHWDLKNPFAKIEPPLQKEPRSTTCFLPISVVCSTTSKFVSRAMAPPSHFTWPMPSFKPPAGSMNLFSLTGAIARGWGRKLSPCGSKAKGASSRMCRSLGA